MIRRIEAVKTIMFVNLVVAVSVIMGLMAFTNVINLIPVVPDARIPVLFGATILYTVLFAYIYEPIIYHIGKLTKCISTGKTEESIVIRPIIEKPGFEGVLSIECDGSRTYKFYSSTSEICVPEESLSRLNSEEHERYTLIVHKSNDNVKGIFKLFYQIRPAICEFTLVIPEKGQPALMAPKDEPSEEQTEEPSDIEE